MHFISTSFALAGILAGVVTSAPTTRKIADYKGRMLELPRGTATNLTRIVTAANSSSIDQNWLFLYAMHGDENEYEVTSAAPSSNYSVLWYIPGHEAGHTHAAPDIVGARGLYEHTFWDVTPVATPRKGYQFVDKPTGKWAMSSSRSGKLTVEPRKGSKVPKEQVFQLITPSGST